MKLNAKSALILSTLLVGTAAMAQTKAPEPDYTLSYNVGVTTDYRYRGLSQSHLKPALQGGADFAHKSGVYLGAWASTIHWIKDAGGSGNVELDLYGGYKGTVGDLGYDVGVLTYQYPSNKLAVNANTTELYGALTFGLVTAKYSHSVTNLFGFANSKNSSYLEAAASFDLGNGYSVAPHIGYQKVAGSGNGVYSYADFSLATAKDFGNGLVASATLVVTDADKALYITPGDAKFTGKTGLVLGLKYNF